MIDYSLRNRRIIEESKDEEVAVILLDVVLGYGANLKPAEELVPVIEDVKKLRPDISVIIPVTGTDMDPQHKQKVLEKLSQAGALVMPSNASSAKLAAEIIAELQY
jgi:FdrA protein